jgi:hypothetical protein
MSLDPEDSSLEEALRADLPAPDVEARLRRRLLAAGMAIGNGVAATTAAASAGSASAASAAKVTSQLLGLSWGLKLGLAAAVTIPTLGLWLERPSALPAPGVTTASSSRPSVSAAAKGVVEASPEHAVEAIPSQPTPPAVIAERAAEAPPERAVARRDKPLEAVTVAAPTATPGSTSPSQSDFAATPEAAAPRPQAVSTLAEETRLLDGAFAELAAGNRERAAELIGQHEARYPQGLLKKERERAKTRLSELSRGE